MVWAEPSFSGLVLLFGLNWFDAKWVDTSSGLVWFGFLFSLVWAQLVWFVSGGNLICRSHRFPTAAGAAPPVATPPASGPLPSPPGAHVRRVLPLRLVDRILVLITRLFLGNLDKLGIQVARWSSRTPREGRRCSTSARSTGSAPATSRLCRESRGSSNNYY